MKKYLLEITVFVTGAAVMILEIVGAKVLASYIGSSIIVWSGLIGVILACLSLGYWYGGKKADQEPSYKIFANIIFFGAVAVFLAAVLKEILPAFLQKNIKNIYFESIFDTLILFGPASFLLAMVSPYAVRLKMVDLEKTGKTVGNLYAISTVGSIFGTFLTCFILLSYFVNFRIILFLAALIFIVSIIVYPKKLFKTKTILFLISIFAILSADRIEAFVGPKDVIRISSQYNNIFISQSIDSSSRRPIRNLWTDPKGIQSAMFLDEDDDLVFQYSKFYRLAEYFNPDIKKSLMLGGGAYTYPNDYLRQYLKASMDIVEIDPKMTETAEKYFNLKQDPRLKIIHEDGRVFLNQTDNKYDAIFIDVFNTYLIPFQLTTEEAAQKMYNALGENGLVMVNIISAINGEKGKFLRAEYATYKKIFPQVYMFSVELYRLSTQTQNLVLLALKSSEKKSFLSDNEEFNYYLSRVWKKEIEQDLPILTDDFAPVDQYLVVAF